MIKEKELSYADQRLAGIGLTAEKYTFEYFPDKIDHWNDQVKSYKKKAQAPYFKNDTNGDLLIQYPSINGPGGLIIETEKSWHFYSRRRKANPKPGAPKYLSDKGASIEIFIPKNTLERVRAGQKIETLFLVEGEIKSVYGDHYGLNICGLAGFHMFIDHKGSWEFHHTIKEILKACKIKNLVLLFDADATKVDFDFENKPDKDYAERLDHFCKAVIKFNQIAQNQNKRAADLEESGNDDLKAIVPFYMQINEMYCDKAKGLDDLLCHVGENTISVTDEMLALKTRGGSFVKCVNLSDKSIPDIERLFYLETDKNGKPSQFINNFYFEVLDHKFWFNNVQWVMDEAKRELVCINHKELQEYVRIGTDYYREIQRVEPYQDRENAVVYKHVRALIPWTKETLQQDFVKGKGMKYALDYIRKFKSFCVVPAHDIDYRRIIDDQYNLYHPLPHVLKPGKWENIEKFLRHLFDNEFQRVYEVALDLFYIKYMLPLQKLPIMVLYSKEKNTGKSTLLWLLNDIYQDNASLIGNKELEDNFDEYKTSNVLLMDELILEKQKHFETLKSWTTAPYSSMNRKSKERVKTVFFSSIFMTTNHLNFVSMDDDENRFFICKVPELKTIDPDMSKRMQEEIPAFLYYLRYEHKMTHPEAKTRFWFPFRAYQTDIEREVKNRGAKMVVKALKEFAREIFFEYAIEVFEYTPIMMLPHLRKYAHRSISNTELINSLKDDFNMKEPELRRFEIPKWDISTDPITDKVSKTLKWVSTYTDENKNIKQCVGKPYRFIAEKWLQPDELASLKDLISMQQKEHKPKTEE